MAKTEDQRRAKAFSVKKHIRRKPKDKPKRPLSAYNYFFKMERQRILKYVQRTPEDVFEEAVVDAEEEKRLWTGTKKVSFEEMGKIIGKRWKSMESTELETYTKLAAGDAGRYKKEIKEWTEKKVEEKKQALADMHAKNAQMQAYQSNPMAGAGYPGPPNGGYHYDPSVAPSSAAYGAGNVPLYPPRQNVPNANASYGQQIGMGSYQYPSYQTAKPDQEPSSSSYSNAPPGSGLPPIDSNSYHNPNPYTNSDGAPSNAPYNGVQNSDYPGGPNNSSSSDQGNPPPNYYTQGQYYGSGSPYQSYPNDNSNPNQQQRWG